MLRRLIIVTTLPLQLRSSHKYVYYYLLYRILYYYRIGVFTYGGDIDVLL
jgi:hypothetical protein